MHRRTISRTIAPLLLVAALASACLGLVGCTAPSPLAPTPTPPAYWPTAGWQTAPAGAHGFDEARLAELKPAIAAELPFLNSLLIVRDGRLVYEAYFNGHDADTLDDVRSVAKSVTSIVAGIAQARGDLSGPDATLGQANPALFAGQRYSVKRNLTLRHLLQMRSGLQWDDGVVERTNATGGADAFLKNDINAYALDQPMAHKPGAAWNYSTADTQLVSALLEGATGRSLKDYAAEHLFAPLGITRFDWQTDSAGHTVGGGGLSLTPRDLAKLGYLYLNRGAWDGRSLVTPDWVRLTTTPQATGVFSDTGQTIPIEWYGMGWWTWRPDLFGGQRAIAAQGYGGQHLILLPDQDVIVVATSGSVVPPEQADAQMAAVYNLVRERIVPAITDRRPADPFWAVTPAPFPPHDALYAASADGRDRRVVLQDPAHGFWGPAWSPDGKRIAFARTIPAAVTPGALPSDLYTASPDGQDVRPLTQNGGNNYLIAWSPDGRQIAHLAGNGDQTEIYLTDVASGRETRLTNDGALQYGIAWSPDGKKLAFGDRRAGEWRIYTMNADGSEQTPTPVAAEGYSPSWSPDGATIAFASERTGNGDIYGMAPDGSNQRLLIGGPAAEYMPAWSPDGRRIAFVSDRDGGPAVYVAAADGSGITRVSGSDLIALAPAWSPDGGRVLFHGTPKEKKGLLGLVGR